MNAVTGISGVPAICAEFLSLAEADVRAAMQGVRYITVSGGDMSEQQLGKLRRITSPADIFKTYGQTEAFRGGMLLPHEFELKMTSVGRPVPGTEIFILGPDGGKAPPDTPGQVIYRGDGMMQGYLGDPAETRKKIRNNPLRPAGDFLPQPVIYTGDIGRIDGDGYLYLLGRRDKMLKIRGNRVYPREILEQILSHDRVVEGVVFGITTAGGEKEVYAEVRPATGSPLTETELGRFLSLRLPSYMVPSRIVMVDSFPRTPSGKIKLSEVEAKYHDEG